MKLTFKMLPYIRILRGLSQDEFAALIGVSQSYLSRVELGKTAFNESFQLRIFEALDRMHISRQELKIIEKLIGR